MAAEFLPPIDEHILPEIWMGVVVVMHDLRQILARHMQIVGKVVIAGGEDHLASGIEARTSQLIQCGDREVFVAAGDLFDGLIKPEVQPIVFRDLAIVFERLIAVWLLVGAGEGYVANLKQLGSGEKGHVRRIVKERVAEATLVNEHGAQAYALDLDRARQTGWTRTHNQNVEGFAGSLTACPHASRLEPVIHFRKGRAFPGPRQTAVFARVI